jgi:hypothetical protein
MYYVSLYLLRNSLDRNSIGIPDALNLLLLCARFKAYKLPGVLAFALIDSGRDPETAGTVLQAESPRQVNLDKPFCAGSIAVSEGKI